jgi:hypothetical protein
VLQPEPVSSGTINLSIPSPAETRSVRAARIDRAVYVDTRYGHGWWVEASQKKSYQQTSKHVAIVARWSCRAGVSDELGAVGARPFHLCSLPFAWSLTAGRGEDVFERVSEVAVHARVCASASVPLKRSLLLKITCCETHDSTASHLLPVLCRQ